MAEVVFFMRFSLISEGGVGWRIAKENSQEKYEETIFEPERIRLRLWALENLSLKSYFKAVEKAKKKNSRVNYTFNILTSELLPSVVREKLEDVAEKYSANVHYLPRVSGYPKDQQEEICRNILKESSYCDEDGNVLFMTANLDDDDVLSENFFLMSLRYLKNNNVGMMVSFPLGFVGHFSKDKYEYTGLKELYLPKINIGLSYINSYIKNEDRFEEDRWPVLYSLGSHINVDAKVPVIVDSSFPAYIYTMHGFNDQIIADLAIDDKWSHYLPDATERNIARFGFMEGFNVSQDLIQRLKKRNSIKLTNASREKKHARVKQLLQALKVEMQNKENLEKCNKKISYLENEIEKLKKEKNLVRTIKKKISKIMRIK